MTTTLIGEVPDKRLTLDDVELVWTGRGVVLTDEFGTSTFITEADARTYVLAWLDV